MTEQKPKRRWRESKAKLKATIADQAKRLENQSATILSQMDALSEWRFRAFLAAVGVVCVALIALGAWLL